MTERLAEQIKRLAKARSDQPAARAFADRLDGEEGLTRELITDPNTLQAVALIEAISVDAVEKTT
jgi:hypothetical protein